MTRHLIVGAGPVGTAAAGHLVRLGHEVVVLTRSGNGPVLPGVSLVAGDASDVDRVAALAAGSASIVNCANPQYHRWSTDWPPIARSLLSAAERTGARLVTMSNLYGFAEGASPMAATDELEPPTEKGRVRVDMWRTALEAHRAGRVEVTEVRASDFVGPGLGAGGHLGDRFVRPILAGRSPRVVGRPDVIHSWTYLDDVGRTLAVVATDDRAVGRAWHVPTLPPMTAQEMADALADAAGVSRVGVASVPGAALRVVGWFSPVMREVAKMRYQFDEPFVIDAADTTEVFGITPTPLVEQMHHVVAAQRGEVTTPLPQEGSTPVTQSRP